MDFDVSPGREKSTSVTRTAESQQPSRTRAVELVSSRVKVL